MIINNDDENSYRSPAHSIDDFLFETEKYYLIEQILTVLKNNSKENNLNLKVLSLNIRHNSSLHCEFVSNDVEESEQYLWLQKLKNSSKYQEIKDKYFKYIDYANFVINIPPCKNLHFLWLSNFMCKINISSLKKKNLMCLHVLNMIPYQFINSQGINRIQIDCVIFNHEQDYLRGLDFELIWYNFINKLNKMNYNNHNSHNNHNNLNNDINDNDPTTGAFEMVFFECRGHSDKFYFYHYETHFSESMSKIMDKSWNYVNTVEKYWEWSKKHGQKECIRIHKRAEDTYTFYTLLKYHFNVFKSSVNDDDNEMSVHNYTQTLKKYQKWFDMGIIQWVQKISKPRFERPRLGGCVQYSYDEFDRDDSD